LGHRAEWDALTWLTGTPYLRGQLNANRLGAHLERRREPASSGYRAPGGGRRG
jgi:hypothetical protein